MMRDLEKLIMKLCADIIRNSTSPTKIASIRRKHEGKLHFIPFEYRVLGGVLQSMNIQWGNFLEKVIEKCLSLDPKNELLVDLIVNKRNSKFKVSIQSDELIDKYIRNCQTKIFTEGQLEKNFIGLLKQVDNFEQSDWADTREFSSDVDLLFSRDEKIYYVEVKYNDDHDTGKFADINRKFIKTYAYIRHLLYTEGINDELIPLLFYFNDSRLKGNIYMPEKTAIYRGKPFFDEFTTTVRHEDLVLCLQNISEDENTHKMFDNLYKSLMRG
jgi:hypothetical protein